MRDEAAAVRRHLWAGAALIMLCLAFAGSAEARVAGAETSTSSASGGEFVKGEIIVKLDEDATDGDLERINDRNGAETEEELPESDLAVVDLPNDLTVGEAVEIYEDSPDIEYAEPDYILRPSRTPNDPSFSSLYAMHNTGQTGGKTNADIDAPEAWATATGDQGTVVAVIDTGVDIEHPDLRENIWVNPDETGVDANGNDKATNGIDDDGNGYKDDVNGWDFANNNASVYDPVSGEGDEHGTHVAGTIAARGDNDAGVVGVNWQASIMPLKFLESGRGSTSDAVEAIDYAIAEGAKISNNSWGGGGTQSLRDAISRANAAEQLFVAAAGNDGANNDRVSSYPANYDLPNIISVAATNSQDALASFSNFGASSVDLAAPGVSIRSTLPGNAYGSFSGTSMATPHVTGVAALLKSENPDMDDAQLKSRILGSVDEKSGLAGKVATGGRLNAANALSDSTEASDTAAPTITPLRPKPETTTKKRSLGITAEILDDRTNLARGDMKLYVDGRGRSFNYDAGSDRLSASSGRLANGAHTIKVVATDDAKNTNVQSWRFRVVR